MADVKAEIKGLKLLGHHNLGGFGNGGEGLAIQTTRDGRRLMYFAHECAPKDFTVIDVTNPRKLHVVAQTNLPHDKVRSNSLALVDDLLLVAYQTSQPGLKPAGVGIYDVRKPESPKKLAFLDTSGPHSRGAHCLWFIDGKYAHVSTGAPDFKPINPIDDQFYMIVDVSNPSRPFEAGRWWLPGIREGDTAPPPQRHTKFDLGFHLHNANVYPERPDRAYVGYVDAGALILDISDMSNPKMISQFDHHPPFTGMTHTVLPLFKRNLLIVTDESCADNGKDWPKLTWVLDMSYEANPVPISTLPIPPVEEFSKRPGRYGAHNLHENQPVPTSWRSENIIVGSYFNGGVRIHDISNPFQPKEVAYFIPSVPDSPKGCQINDVYVDEKGILYAIDRFKGGIYNLEMNF